MKKIYPLSLLSFACLLSVTACKKANTEADSQTFSLKNKVMATGPVSGMVAPVTQTYTENVGSQAVANRLIQSNHNEMLSTGYYVAANDSIYVTVAQVSGTRLPQLVLGTPFRDNIRPVRTYYTLQVGLNKIKADQYGGMAWVKYVSSATPAASASMSFGKGFKPVPYFKKNVTTHADWLTMLDSLSNVPDVIIETDRALVVARRDDAITYKTDDQQLLSAKIDQIVDAEDAFSGIDGSTSLHTKGPYKYLITVKDLANSGDYMAAGIGIFYVRSLTYRILQNANVGGVLGWGLWHEVGHIHQQGPWTWTGLTEVTVNLYAMAAERYFAVTPSRMNRDGKWTSVDNYFAIPQASRNFNGTVANANDTRLGMFYQLWLAYGDSFYIALHKQTRTENPSLTTDAAKMRYFMLKACNISGKDLSDFFKKWGLPVTQSVYDEITALGLHAPATDLTTLRD